jgi:ribosomal protein L37E
MKRIIIEKIIKVLCPLAIFLIVCNFAFADLGNFNDYSSGGSGGGWDGGSSGGYSSSHGSSSWDFSNSSGGSYGLIITDMYGMIIIFAIFGAILLYKFLMDKAEQKVFGVHSLPRNNAYGGAQNIPDNTDAIQKAVMEIDANFSADKFLNWAKEVFITLQTAWSERDWEKARPFETEELYRQHELQIKEYIDKGRINALERININNAYLYRYKRDAKYEYLAVYINARMTDYIIDENTREVLKGNPNEDCFLRYILSFVRKKGFLTAVQSGSSAVSCPQCGAPVKMTSAGKCNYCGFIVKTGDYSWVLADIEGVKAGVNYGSGGVIISCKKEK